MKKETKDTIIILLLGISLVSFIVMLWSIFFHLSIWGLFAIPVCGLSFSIALALGTPNDEGKGLFARGRDLG